MNKSRLFFTSLLVFALVPLAMAQTETGQIAGTVLDPTGASIPGATVTVKSVAMGLTRQVKTSDAGGYILTSVLPGEYEITAEAQGFSKSVRRSTLTVGAKIGVDFHLEIGKAETVIQVSEVAAPINTETQTVSTVISQQAIADMPTMTRNPYDLVATAGNVSDGTPDGRGVGYAINGQRAASTNVLLDGSANNDEFAATVGQSVPLDSVQEFSVLTTNFTAEFGRASGGIVNVATKSGSNDFHGTVYEFNRVSALASNDFNNNANDVAKQRFTRNQFGYSVGGPIKKDKLFFFNNIEWIRVRSASNRIVWIPADGLISASASNTQDFFNAFGKVRSGVQDQGTFTKGDLKAQGFDPCKGGSATGGCAMLPDSTPMFRRLVYTYPSDSGGGLPENQYQMVSRVDYNMSSATQLYGRVALQNASYLVGTNANSPYDGFDTGETVVNQNWLVSVIHTFTPSFITQSKAVFNRLNDTQPLGKMPPTPTLYMLGTTPASILGHTIGMPGYLPFSPGTAIPFGGPQNFVQLYHDMNYNRGKHQLRFGVSYNYMRDNRTFGAYLNPVQQLGNKFGKAIDNLIAGQLYAFQGAIDPQGKYPCNGAVTPDCSVTLPVGPPSFSRSNRYNEFAYYAQDSYRVTRTVTLNLGLRWEYFGVQHNKNPKLDSNFYLGSGSTIFDQLRKGQVMLAPDSPVHGIWAKDFGDYAPRLGLAWDVFGDGKTSLRGGYGIGYERNFGNVTFNIIQNPPNYAVISLLAGSDIPQIPISTELAGPLAGSQGSKGIPRVSLRAINQNLKTAYAQFWSVSLEHQFTQSIVAALEYSGSAGERLYSIENPNRPGAGNYYLGDPCDPTAGNCVSRLLLNQGFSNINLRGGNGLSNHNGLNTRLDIRDVAKTGLNLSMNWMWAHTLDNLSDTFSSSGNQMNLGMLDPFNPKVERGDAYFDIRHRVAISGMWEIPVAKQSKGVAKQVLGGWELSPILTMETGTPFSLFDCWNAYSTCPYAMFGNKITTYTGNSNGPALSTPNTIKYFDIAALTPYHDWVNPKVGWSDFGPYPSYMVGRNVFRGPGSWNLDLGINKNFRFTERFTLQLRFETYNTLNHANLSLDTTANDTSAYDSMTASRYGRRNTQLAAKFIF